MASTIGSAGTRNPADLLAGLNGSQGQQSYYNIGGNTSATGAQQNPNPGSQGATDAAKAAVTGLQAAGPGIAGDSPYTAGGAGSSYSVGADGKTSYTTTPNLIPQETNAQKELNDQQNLAASGLAKQQSDAEAALLAQKAGLADQSFKSKLTAVQGMAGTSPQVSFPGAGGASSDAARNAAFARAKDQAGLTGNAALQSLRDAIGSRGLQGSSIENNGLAEVMGGTAGNINDFTREQLISDLNRNSQVEDETYQGNITQRGQDLQRQQALLALINSGPAY